MKVDKNKDKDTAGNINESSPLQTKEENKEESKYQSVNINTKGVKKFKNKYEGEEKCLQHWLFCCLIFVTAIIPIAEIIILVYFYINLTCPLQKEWSYFILTKLIFELISIPLFIAFYLSKSGKQHIKTIASIASIAYTCLFIWTLILTIELFKYFGKDINNTHQSCDLLIDFMLFESVSCWAVIFIIFCSSCWWYYNEPVIEFLVFIISTIAHVMHNLVIKVTFTMLYQWCMSIIEIVFLGIYYNNYGNCNPEYVKYILSKFVFTVIVIACNNLLKFDYLKQFINILYVILLVIWCIVASIKFWTDSSDNILCRTNTFTEHFFDFIMLDILLGFVVVATVFCQACWIKLADYLGQPGVVETYGEFASHNTAEWIRYKESRKK